MVSYLMGKIVVRKFAMLEVNNTTNWNNDDIKINKTQYINFMAELYVFLRENNFAIKKIVKVLYYTSLSQYIFIEDMATDEGKYGHAFKLVMTYKKPSASFLQRKLQISYGQAVAYLDRMQREGWVSDASEIGKRKILKIKFTEERML